MPIDPASPFFRRAYGPKIISQERGSQRWPLGLLILALSQRWLILLAVGASVVYLVVSPSCQPVRKVNLAATWGWPLALAFDDAGRVRAATSLDHRVQAWLLEPDGDQPEPVGPAQHGFVATFLPEAATVAVGGDSVVMLWDLEAQRPRRVLPTGDGRTNALAVSREGKVVAAAGQRAVLLWNERSGWTRKSLGTGPHAITALALALRGRRLATGGKDGIVRVWDLATGEQQLRIEASRWHVNSLCFSEDGNLLASASNSERVARIHDATTGRVLATLQGHLAPVLSLEFAPERSIVATASADGTARLWDARSGRQRACLNLGENEVQVSSVAFSRDGRRLAIAGAGNLFRLWDVSEVLTNNEPRP
jgi:WD40 repeat protein